MRLYWRNTKNKKIFPVLLLLVFFCICFFSQKHKSITVDEFNHFPAGIYNLVTFDWRMDCESPPFIKCLPSITALFSKPKIPAKSFADNPNPWAFGYDFMYRNFQSYISIIFWGRLVIISLACFGGWLLYKFSEDLFGSKTALFVLFLYVFNPNIIAHSRLTTIDVGAMVMFLWSVYAFWKFLIHRSIRESIVLGFILGLAELSKFTALILYPIFIIIFILISAKNYLNNKRSFLNSSRRFFSDSGLLAFSVLISLLVINVGYLFSGSFFRLDDYSFSSDVIEGLAGSPLGNISIPLPVDYVMGFDAQLNISKSENPFYLGYLMGKHSIEGWWYYYLVGVVVKNAEIMWVCFFLSLIFWIKNACKIPLETWLCIWVPLVIFICYFSFFTNTPIGIRFLLPIFPLIFIASGYLIRSGIFSNALGCVFAAVLVVLYAVPSLAIYPNYLSYFNLASGGPQKGHYWLIDSNLDWGQDLVSLKKYMQENGIRTIKLGYFGRVDPNIYGIDYVVAPQKPGSGFHAISINFLIGRPYYMTTGSLFSLKYIDFDHYFSYRSLRPVAILGNTIYIYNPNNK